MLTLFCVAVTATWAEHQSGVAHEHSPLEIMGRKGFYYKPSRSPLSGAILVLHGSMVLPSTMFNLGFEELADTRGFLVVYPEMQTPEGWEWGFHDDIPYFSALANRLQEADFRVPRDKIFICGHSSGGGMVTFLQREMDDFEAAGVVEGTVERCQEWHEDRHGKRTMVIWNHADPMLTTNTPDGDEKSYYYHTVHCLRRDAGQVPDVLEPLPTLHPVVKAEMRVFGESQSGPELRVVSWRSDPGRHEWATPSWTNSLDATRLLVDFFFRTEHAVGAILT